jgi:hypothetical protein
MQWSVRAGLKLAVMLGLLVPALGLAGADDPLSREVVCFSPASGRPARDADARLRKVLAQLRRHPHATVLIAAYCENRSGTREYALAYCQRLADRAGERLARLGADPQRITAVSYGRERIPSPGRKLHRCPHRAEISVGTGQVAPISSEPSASRTGRQKPLSFA